MQPSITLPLNSCCRQCYGLDEWYIFLDQPMPLGSLSRSNVFTSEIAPGNVFQFINFGGFRFSDSEMNPVSDLFWQQMDWVRPESYVAAGQDCLLFATSNSTLYNAVCEALRKQRSKYSESE